MTKLSSSDIRMQLQKTPHWKLDEGTIARTFKLKDFYTALLFVNAVGWLAEAAGHHPDIMIRYNTVELRLNTHDAGGITVKDFALAQQIDALPTIG
ncbi:MAG: 4a-hydroxytetrahydrobiopterin dehydratase [Anaerolineae bacterium]|nr:4a-hydroxytetrahydrobiopterin dehydratase [Anaerolineae bacterium]